MYNIAFNNYVHLQYGIETILQQNWNGMASTVPISSSLRQLAISLNNIILCILVYNLSCKLDTHEHDIRSTPV